MLEKKKTLSYAYIFLQIVALLSSIFRAFSSLFIRTRNIIEMNIISARDLQKSREYRENDGIINQLLISNK